MTSSPSKIEPGYARAVSMQSRTEVHDRFQKSDITRLKGAGRCEFGLNVHHGNTKPTALRIRRWQVNHRCLPRRIAGKTKARWHSGPRQLEGNLERAKGLEPSTPTLARPR